MKVRASLLVLFPILLGACAGVLGIRPSSSVHPFEHRAHVTHGVSCTACHAGVSGSEGRGALHLPDASTCRSCHTRPHDERACSGCHGEAHVRQEAELAHDHLRFSHRQHMPAAKGDCVRCHSAVGEAAPGALRPKMATCFGCHEHQDQWRTRDCDACHVDLPAERVLPESHVVHDGDWIHEHGLKAASQRDLCATCHSERSCAACHGVTVPGLPSRLEFETRKLEALHPAGFRSRHALEASASPGLCTTCHDARFCSDCHDAAGVSPGHAKRSPHPATWLTAGRGGGDHGVSARLDPESCAGCHGGAGEQLCVGCHRVGGAGGSPHGPGFTSTKDKLRDLPCRLCHGIGP